MSDEDARKIADAVVVALARETHEAQREVARLRIENENLRHSFDEVNRNYGSLVYSVVDVLMKNGIRDADRIKRIVDEAKHYQRVEAPYRT